MAQKIILKKSSVAGIVPAAADLDPGEVAVNLADRKLFSKNAVGTVVSLGGASIDDGVTATETTWSSSKINGVVGDVETLLAAL